MRKCFEISAVSPSWSCNSHYRILSISKKMLPRSHKFRKNIKQNMWEYVEVVDFIPAEYEFRLIRRLFDSLLISKLFFSSNLKWVTFSISVICFILLWLYWGYFLSKHTSSVEAMQLCGCELLKEQIWKAHSVQPWGWNVCPAQMKAGTYVLLIIVIIVGAAGPLKAWPAWIQPLPYKQTLSGVTKSFLNYMEHMQPGILSNIQIKCSCLLKETLCSLLYYFVQ